jgi:hypothetical protein
MHESVSLLVCNDVGDFFVEPLPISVHKFKPGRLLTPLFLFLTALLFLAQFGLGVILAIILTTLGR